MGKSHEKHASKVEADCNNDLESQKDVYALVRKEEYKVKVGRADSEERDKLEATLKKPKTLGKAESKDCVKTRVNLKKNKKHALDVGRATSFNDLPLDLVGEKILSKVPITCLGAVRCTCKLWNALSKEWMLSNARTSKRQFFSLMTMDYKVYSLGIHLHRDEYNGVDLSRKQVYINILNQVEISKVFHCQGLLLCVLEDNSRLVVWNPYLGQTRWIEPRTNFHKRDRYAFGYDKNRNHKILRCFDDYDVINKKHSFMVEIYDFISHSWRVLDHDVTSDLDMEYGAHGWSLKGNAYFLAIVEVPPGDDDFLICFDFTNEIFGPLLPLPFDFSFQQDARLSCVGEEQLALLYQYQEMHTRWTFEFWMTTKIGPDTVSWSKFLKVNMIPHFCYFSEVLSFFIYEEEKVAAVAFSGDEGTVTYGYHSAFIVGEDAYFQCVNLGKCPTVSRPPLLCSSSYFPSLVHIN